MSRTRQPYHAAEAMKVPQAEVFLRRTRQESAEKAEAAVKDAVGALSSEGYRVTWVAVLQGSGRPLPELGKILAAHPLIHTAEGVFFRDVLESACEACGLAVTGIKEREVLEECAAALRTPVEDLQARLAAMGKALGPPWTQDEKLAAAAALVIGRMRS
jgi:HEAT repeat protein